MLIPAFLLLLQSAAPTMTPQMPTAPLPIPRRKPAASAPPALAAPVMASRLASCLAQADADPAAALSAASDWGAAAKGSAAIDPAQCRGAALAGLSRWTEAIDAFAMARDLESLPEHRARLGAMAGNAALAARDFARAETLFAAARADAAPIDAGLAADISVDRARAQFGLKQLDAVAASLAEGRAGNPANANAWLLSATLSRQHNRLAEAQGWIERAAALDPANPAIGLEAGAIAALSGRDDAARRSWQSVVATAPETPEATSARAYLAQLGGQSPSPGR